jgi:adenylate kinase
LIESLGITGTPGTGKKTIAPLVASRLGFSTLDLNALAIHGERSNPGEAIEVEIAPLRRRIQKLEFESKVVYGHLLPDVMKKGELPFVVVLRCNPMVLKKRLSRRGYSHEKLRENLEAELIGVSLADCLKKFGQERLLEYDTSHSKPERVAKQMLSDVLGPRRQKKGWIDWTLRYNSSRKLRSLFSTERMDSALT